MPIVRGLSVFVFVARIRIKSSAKSTFGQTSLECAINCCDAPLSRGFVASFLVLIVPDFLATTIPYRIITAYELRDGTVVPLDGLDIDGSLLEPYAGYLDFKGWSAPAFLKKVRETLVSPIPVQEQ